MIAMCRAMNIPARIVTGTDYGANPSIGRFDFPAYVEAYLVDRWYLFDPSGIKVLMGFIRIGTGRDAADGAFATLFGKASSKAPWVRARAINAAWFVLPQHCSEALSTTTASSSIDAGCATFGAPSNAREPVRQLCS